MLSNRRSDMCSLATSQLPITRPGRTLGRAGCLQGSHRQSADRAVRSPEDPRRSRWTKAGQRSRRHKWSNRMERLPCETVAQVSQKTKPAPRARCDSVQPLNSLGMTREVEDRRVVRKLASAGIEGQSHASLRARYLSSGSLVR
jgi:hypothetical protein